MPRNADYTADRLAARERERRAEFAARLQRLLSLAPGADFADLQYLVGALAPGKPFDTLCFVLRDVTDHVLEN